MCLQSTPETDSLHPPPAPPPRPPWSNTCLKCRCKEQLCRPSAPPGEGSSPVEQANWPHATVGVGSRVTPVGLSGKEHLRVPNPTVASALLSSSCAVSVRGAAGAANDYLLAFVVFPFTCQPPLQIFLSASCTLPSD